MDVFSRLVNLEGKMGEIKRKENKRKSNGIITISSIMYMCIYVHT